MNNNYKNSSLISMAVGSFHGGIHPPEFKDLSNQTSIQTYISNSELIIPLQQHTGEAANLLIKRGDNIIKGQLIAKAVSPLSANIHSPVYGSIKEIKSCDVGHASGSFQDVIVIQNLKQPSINSKSEIPSKLETTNWQSLSTKKLLAKIQQAGIVGLGGATFPTAVKLASQNINTLIVNGMECEPYITCDDRLLQENSAEIIQGAQITAKILAASEIIFAIEDNKPLAIEALECAMKFNLERANKCIPMKIVVSPTKYPSGGEKQTIELVLNKQIPQGKRPSSIGVVMQNTATLFAIYDAIINNKPLTQRLITITGDLVSNAGNYWIPFGTKLIDIIQYFEIPLDKLEQVIIGGPLMGNSITNFEIPVTKATNCIIFNSPHKQSKSWLTEATPHQECIRCSDCEKVCPVELLPQQLYWFSQSDQWQPLEQQGIFDCIDCGACAYVCPSEIPLVHYFRYAKSTIKNNKVKQANADAAKTRFEFREQRLLRDKQERTLKHEKAAEERRKAAINNQQDPSGKQTAINQALQRVKQKKAQETQTKNTGEK